MSDIKKDYKNIDYKDIDDMFYYENVDGARAMTASERFREVKYCFGNLLSSVEDVGGNLKAATHKAFLKVKLKPLSEKLIERKIKKANKAVLMLSDIKSKLIGLENILKEVKLKLKPACFYNFNYIRDDIFGFLKFSKCFVGFDINNNLNLYGGKLEGIKNEKPIDISQAEDGCVDIMSLLFAVQTNNIDIMKKAEEISEIPGSPNFEWKDTSQLEEHIFQLKNQIDDVHMKCQLIEKSMLSLLNVNKK